MKRILLALLLPATLMVMSFSGAQTPDANQEQRLLALIKEVQTQQTQMAENQKKIETKLAEIGERFGWRGFLQGDRNEEEFYRQPIVTRDFRGDALPRQSADCTHTTRQRR